MLTGKIWGATELLLTNPFFELHRLTIKPNARCSMHVHRYKWNAFMVLEGELDIEVRKNDYKLTDITTLKKGYVCKVRPGEHHRFITSKKGCVALEMYYCEPLSEDIIREDHGAVNHANRKRKKK